MDDRTRTPDSEPEDQSAGSPEGIGWSTPQRSSSQAGAPWSGTSDETGSVPRPDETRQIPSAATSHAGTGTTDGQAAYGGIPAYESTPQPANADGRSKGRSGIALIAAVALGAGLVGGAAGAGIVSALDQDDEPAQTSSFDNDATETADLPEGSGIEAVADAVSPSVVSIGIESERGSGGGSGVIISSDGQIMTNAHVAAAAGNEGALTVTLHDGRTTQAEVVGMDEQMDVAILQAQDASDLQPAELGDSDSLAVGSEVIAFGSPLGLEGTVTQGIVSALHRPVQAGGPSQQNEPTVFEAIQTDAPINPGNSGGPLVNAAGRVVGINTAIATSPGSQGSIGLGFAIPINTAEYIAEQIVEDGEVEYARIGIGVSNGDGSDPAATVAEVQEGGAADEAGLEQGDVITHVDGRYISNATALVAAARSYQPGDEITLTYVRDGEENTVEMTLGTSADDE